MYLERDNDNDEYYVPIKTRLGQINFNPNCFGQVAAIALGLLTCQFNSLLKTSRPGSIEPSKMNCQIYQYLNQPWTTWI